jgi:hypothetical protein
MNADADVNLVSRVLAVIVSPQPCLNLLGALDRMNDRREIYREGIARNLDDCAVVVSHRLLVEKLIVNL